MYSRQIVPAQPLDDTRLEKAKPNRAAAVGERELFQELRCHRRPVSTNVAHDLVGLVVELRSSLAHLVLLVLNLLLSATAATLRSGILVCESESHGLDRQLVVEASNPFCRPLKAVRPNKSRPQVPDHRGHLLLLELYLRNQILRTLLHLTRRPCDVRRAAVFAVNR